jgi:hypothetical protein
MNYGAVTGTPEDGATFESTSSVPVVVYAPAP